MASTIPHCARVAGTDSQTGSRVGTRNTRRAWTSRLGIPLPTAARHPDDPGAPRSALALGLDRCPHLVREEVRLRGSTLPQLACRGGDLQFRGERGAQHLRSASAPDDQYDLGTRPHVLGTPNGFALGGRMPASGLIAQVFTKSRFDLPDAEVDRYFERSFESVVEYLIRGPTSAPGELDPVGELSLKLAKKVRRRALSDRTADHPEVLKEMADAFFPFPDTPLVHWPRIKDPDFAAGVTSRRAAEHALGA